MAGKCSGEDLRHKYGSQRKRQYIKIIAIISNERNSLQIIKLVGNSFEKFEKKYPKKIRKSTGSLEGRTASNPYLAYDVQYADSTLSNGNIPQDGVKSQEESEKNSSTESDNKRFSRSKRDMVVSEDEQNKPFQIKKFDSFEERIAQNIEIIADMNSVCDVDKSKLEKPGSYRLRFLRDTLNTGETIYTPMNSAT